MRRFFESFKICQAPPDKSGIRGKSQTVPDKLGLGPILHPAPVKSGKTGKGRATLLCTLFPDPGDPVKRKELLEKIGGTVTTSLKKKRDGNGNLIEEEVRGSGSDQGNRLRWFEKS